MTTPCLTHPDVKKAAPAHGSLASAPQPLSYTHPHQPTTTRHSPNTKAAEAHRPGGFERPIGTRERPIST